MRSMATALSEPGTIFGNSERIVLRRNGATNYIREFGGRVDKIIERWLHKTQVPVQLSRLAPMV
jgi:hypothetical protein